MSCPQANGLASQTQHQNNLSVHLPTLRRFCCKSRDEEGTNCIMDVDTTKPTHFSLSVAPAA